MNIEWNRVTWYSKLIAIIIFLITACLFFKFGAIYGSATTAISDSQVYKFQPQDDRGINKIAPPSTTNEIISSSSAQVGEFTAVTDCGISGGTATVIKIEIFKQGSLLQTISNQNLEPGGSNCPTPKVRDINNDGYPDFIIPYNYGNKYTNYEYWLYGSSSDQFSCPNINPTSNKPWMNCSLVEPN